MESLDYYPNLDVGHVLGRAWDVFKENMGLIFLIVIVQILVVMVSAVIPLLPLLVGGPIQMGVYYTFVRMVRGEDVELRDMFDIFQQFGRALGLYWVYTLAVLAGVVLLIIPGIVLAIGLFPVYFLVQDDTFGIGDTLQEAWDMTRGYKWSLFVLALVVMCLTILGVVVFIIGAVIAAIYGYVVMAVAYDELAQARR